MSHSGSEAVRKIVAQAPEVQQPQYISFGFYKMDGDGLAFLQAKGKSEEQSSAWISVSGPFEILGRVRDPKGEGWHGCCVGQTTTTVLTAIPSQTPTCTAIFLHSAPIWQAAASGSVPAQIASTS